MDSVLEFPCRFPIKIMGKASDDFDTHVVGIVRRHVPDLGEGAVSMQRSRNGNYISVTVTFQATSRRQLDDLYRELTASDKTLVVL